jgi:hypothetical protein
VGLLNMEGEYADLSVEEKIIALVALIQFSEFWK